MADSTISNLERRIKELEEGSCRFNCRDQKAAFMAGFEAGFHEGFWVEGNSADPHKDCFDSPSTHYLQWLKDRE